jgi:hypothetical protein
MIHVAVAQENVVNRENFTLAAPHVKAEVEFRQHEICFLARQRKPANAYPPVFNLGCCWCHGGRYTSSVKDCLAFPRILVDTHYVVRYTLAIDDR